MSKKLLFPDDARLVLARKFDTAWRSWLCGEGTWPLSIALGAPTEAFVTTDTASVRAWIDAWHCWSGAGSIRWLDRLWPRLGQQRLPASLDFSTSDAVAAAVGQGARWATARARYDRMVTLWPHATGPVLARYFDVLAAYADTDFDRMVSLLDWVGRNPASGLYLRQLPLPGLDTKWVESRSGLATKLLRLVLHTPAEGDFRDLCGLKRPPQRIRLILLCPRLRRLAGGLRDIETPADEAANLPIDPARCLIVENLETGLALPDREDTMAVVKLGNAVDVLGRLPWIAGTDAVYWGDIDTHGFAILDRARQAVPGLRSVLMDETTLLSHRDLWGHEPVQHPAADLAALTASERNVFQALRGQHWGANIRLEQERIDWPGAVAMVASAFAKDPTESS